MAKTLHTGTMLLALALLAGCAGWRGTPDTPPAAASPRIDGVAVVTARLSPEATKQLAEAPQFSRDELAGTLRRRLQAKGLVATSANHKIEVWVTDIRLRSGAVAAYAGVPGWDDHVHGTVRIVNANGQVVRSIDIKAAYSVTLHGRDVPRMAWLCDRFSELAVAELEKTIAAPRATTAQR